MKKIDNEGMREGYVRLSSPKGIVDTRNGGVFTEVVVKAKDAKWFREVGDEG